MRRDHLTLEYKSLVLLSNDFDLITVVQFLFFCEIGVEIISWHVELPSIVMSLRPAFVSDGN